MNRCFINEDLNYGIMKRLILSLIFFIILLSSCDPDNKDIFNFEIVKLGAVINNTTENLSLGDTLKISLQLPDTLFNSADAYFVHSVQQAQFYLKFRIVDTINNRAKLVNFSSYWTTYGSISPTNIFDFQFEKNTKPYGVVIYFKPPQKGIYYLEVVSQAGQLKINNTYESRLYVNFNVPDKHLNLASQFLGGQLWLDNAISKDSEGFGKYVFRVN